MKGIKSKTKLEMAARREKVAQALLAGLTYREIAAELGVALSTVACDVKAILGALETETLTDAAEYRKLELRRLDMMQNKVWLPAMRGSLGAVDRLLKIQDQRAKYMPGVQDAARHELSGPNGGPITYLEQQREADRILSEVEAYEQSKRESAP